VREWLREGGAVLCSFIDWFLLLLIARCLLGVSRVSCLVCERELHIFITLVEQFGAWGISLSLRERD